MALATGFENFTTPDAPLADRTWLRVGGTAKLLARPSNVDELIAVVARCREEGVSVRLLGGGSNVLVRDSGYDGVVVSLEDEAFHKVEIEGNRVRAGGGASLAKLINDTVRSGLAGLDPLVGIPGTVGAALHNNSGGRGGDIGQCAREATVLTRSGETLTRTRDDMVFAYRESSLDELVILEAEFELEPQDPDTLTKRMQKQWIVQKSTQPMTHQRAAQVFRNPRGMSAGMLIDQAGLKGAAVGGAEVSPKHANYIVAHDGASSDDIEKLIDKVRDSVAERMGVELERALEIW
ncbi:UDP-N-acetylenolpyruvoylglucosamine reductase MurB [Pseudobythopirellula maris]|uniref:UDP-N-acetylenolpyruvoylglucosamine reductase n=1 Tax=Pseudobythopirellula maris TaxID=2527991 RepID=A0A5C5ZSW9_9BACT|nr:UDP-N-acetylmuramate dehydrogenase [Pseudobythopirellula maris]TWT90165.1 UDP-N-acetylenolpyruvoylglucosamine reductase MurB [Pseudobythopirellula maris]